MRMRTLPIGMLSVGIFFLGCGDGDPCLGKSGKCVTLTVRSAVVKKIDTLSLKAFGESRMSTGLSSSLPVRLALVAPAGATGQAQVTAEASLGGSVVGHGTATIQIGPMRATATIDLLSGPGSPLNCDTMNDSHNCGACGHDCALLPHVADGAAVACQNGHCVVPPSVCAPGFGHCSANPDDGCETDLSQSDHCGGCNACPSATPLCASGASGYVCSVTCAVPTPDRCGDSCVDLQSSAQHCKTCENICTFANAGADCMQGACIMGACQAGYDDCVNGPNDGCETYVMGSDNNNCGGCGHSCPVGQLCNSGQCKENTAVCSQGVTCAQSGCYSNHFSISAGGEIAVDLINNRRLWTRLSRGPATHSAASDDCLTLVVEGINGWRLPATFTELGQTLYLAGGLQGCPVCAPAIDQAAFPDTSVGDSYWTNFYNSSRAGYDTVVFCDGRNNYQTDAAGTLLYRCTHDPL